MVEAFYVQGQSVDFTGCVFFARADGVETQLDDTEMVTAVLDPEKNPEVRPLDVCVCVCLSEVLLWRGLFS